MNWRYSHASSPCRSQHKGCGVLFVCLCFVVVVCLFVCLFLVHSSVSAFAVIILWTMVTWTARYCHSSFLSAPLYPLFVPPNRSAPLSTLPPLTGMCNRQLDTPSYLGPANDQQEIMPRLQQENCGIIRQLMFTDFFVLCCCYQAVSYKLHTLKANK